MIKKIRMTRAKNSYRYKGVGLTKAEEAMMLKINEMVEEIRKIQ